MPLANSDKLALLAAATGPIVVDTEVVPVAGVSVCFEGLSNGFYLPINHPDADNLTFDQMDELFGLEGILDNAEALVFHNAAHDLKVLKAAGFNYQGKFYDTMIMAHWINEERFNYGLDAISKLYGGKPKNPSKVMQHIIEKEGWAAVPYHLMDEYSSNDAFITFELFKKLLVEFQEQDFDGPLWDIEQEFIRDCMIPMMELGVKVDTEFCMQEYLKGMQAQEECKAELGFNPNSPKQLKQFLIDELELPVLSHTKSCPECKKRRPVDTHQGPPSFDKDAMAEYDALLQHNKDSRAQTILRYRGWLKTTSSNYKPYMELMDENSILHPGYKLHGTRTGRLSCEKPNLQQIPKTSEKEWNGRLKQAFVARPGYKLWEIDFSQLQFRMTCAYAEQMDLIEVFNTDRDIFSEMAADMEWLRDNVKTLVYLILFGGGATRASVAFNVGIEKGSQLVSQFHNRYPRIKRIAKDCEKVAKHQKYIKYWTGRRRHFFPNGAPTYRAFNAAIQGGEAEIMKRAMIHLKRNVLDENCRMVLQIHDAIVFEIKEGMEGEYLPRCQKEMESAPDGFCEFIGVQVNFSTEVKQWPVRA